MTPRIRTVTFGFFGAHSVVSSWVGLRAKHAKAQAAARGYETREFWLHEPGTSHARFSAMLRARGIPFTALDASVEQVEQGTTLVGRAGSTMDEIVGSVKRVTDIMSEITAASQEQSQGIEQVNQTITQMDEVTQQNAALVEEATASARSLEEQAEGLAQSVSVFTLEEQVQKPVMGAARSQQHQAVGKRRHAGPVGELGHRGRVGRAVGEPHDEADHQAIEAAVQRFLVLARQRGDTSHGLAAPVTQLQNGAVGVGQCRQGTRQGLAQRGHFGGVVFAGAFDRHRPFVQHARRLRGLRAPHQQDAIGHQDGLDDAGNGRRDLGVDLVGRDLEQRLVDLDPVAHVLQPTGDRSLDRKSVV